MTYQWDTTILREDAEGNEDEFEVKVLYEFSPGRAATYWDPPECDELEITHIEYQGKDFPVTPSEAERLDSECYLYHLSTLE